MSIVEFRAVDIVFGERPKDALPLIDAGQDRDRILRETGNVVGVAGASIAIEEGEICVLMGLSGSGKSTLAFAVEKELLRLGCASYVLDGDNVRHGLNRDLGFAPAERTENIRRIAEVAHLMNDAGLIVIAAFIAPYRVDRQRAREVVGDSFFEVFVDAPIEVCEERDPKGLYAKARRGEISDFTGISAPYEQPENPDVHLNTDQMSPEEAAREVVRKLQERGIVPGQRDG